MRNVHWEVVRSGSGSWSKTLYEQRLWFEPPWLTHRQTCFDRLYTISSAPAELHRFSSGGSPNYSHTQTQASRPCKCLLSFNCAAVLSGGSVRQIQITARGSRRQSNLKARTPKITLRLQKVRGYISDRVVTVTWWIMLKLSIGL